MKAGRVVQRPWTDELRARIDRVLDGQGVVDRADLVDTQTMAVPVNGQGVRLVEVRGIERGYPFYGAPELAGGVAYSHALVEQHGFVAVAIQPAQWIRIIRGIFRTRIAAIVATPVEAMARTFKHDVAGIERGKTRRRFPDFPRQTGRAN